jgi:hypothetical protein
MEKNKQKNLDSMQKIIDVKKVDPSAYRSGTKKVSRKGAKKPKVIKGSDEIYSMKRLSEMALPIFLFFRGDNDEMR